MAYYFRSPSLSSPWIMHYIEFNRWEAYQVRKSYYVHVGAFVSMHRCVCLCEKLQRLLHILQLMNVKITKQSATQWNKKTVWANGREKKLHCNISRDTKFFFYICKTIDYRCSVTLVPTSIQLKQSAIQWINNLNHWKAPYSNEQIGLHFNWCSR